MSGIAIYLVMCGVFFHLFILGLLAFLLYDLIIWYIRDSMWWHLRSIASPKYRDKGLFRFMLRDPKQTRQFAFKWKGSKYVHLFALETEKGWRKRRERQRNLIQG